MKDKISKIKNLVKKYGVKGTSVKVWNYIKSNYFAKFSIREQLYVRKYKKRITHSINMILDNEHYERIVIWRSSFGWNVPLYQRPQHIFSNFAKQNTLVFYEVTTFTDKVDRIEKQNDNLYLVNFANKAFSNILMTLIEKRNVPKYVEFYSTDWTLRKTDIVKYMSKGYKVVYEYIDDLNPLLAGTDSLPRNIIDKYNMMMESKEIFTVVTADALWKDVVKKRGTEHLVFSGNGVDYGHFHDSHNADFVFEKQFLDIISIGQPIIGYYGAIAKWMDYQLLKKIAETKKYQIILLGIPYDDSYEQAKLGQYSNIHYLGARDYSVLQYYAAKMDVLTIPFLLNDITRATSPVKLFEYMALNKPIVTTDMDECRKYRSVLIGKNHKEFIDKLDEALEKRENVEYKKMLNQEALKNTWNEKAKVILQMLACSEKDGYK